MNRWQLSKILQDLNKKMVILVGPRQAGKTWLANAISSQISPTVYLNYDRAADREIMQTEAWLESTQLLILDELHKMPGWKNYLKGIYDTKPASMKILVTGSARLEVFNQLGDSLAGRYFTHHLLPLSLAELNHLNVPVTLDYLLERGGFPEPFLANDSLDARRWRLEYSNSLLTMDALEFANIRDMRALKLIFELLRQRVGSTISFNSIAEDIAVSPTTVMRYVEILEALYIVFRVTPYSKNIARSLLKEPKIYFYDTGLVQNGLGAQFENLVASSLLKHIYAKRDYEALEYGLHYLRTKDGEEVDFALVNSGDIEQIIEAKLTDHTMSKSLITFHKKYNFPAVQVVKELKREYQKDGISVRAATSFLRDLLL